MADVRSSKNRLSTAKPNFMALLCGRDSNSILIFMQCNSVRGQPNVSASDSRNYGNYNKKNYDIGAIYPCDHNQKNNQ